MVLAILYIEVDRDSPSTPDQLQRGLSNCKTLVTRLSSDDVIVRIQCDDPESLNQAITRDLAAIEGVTRITTCVLINR